MNCSLVFRSEVVRLCLVETIKINWSLCSSSGTTEQLCWGRARSQISGLATCQGGGVMVRETVLQHIQTSWTLCLSLQQRRSSADTATTSQRTKTYVHNNRLTVWFKMWIGFIWLWCDTMKAAGEMFFKRGRSWHCDTKIGKKKKSQKFKVIVSEPLRWKWSLPCRKSLTFRLFKQDFYWAFL